MSQTGTVSFPLQTRVIFYSERVYSSFCMGNRSPGGVKPAKRQTLFSFWSNFVITKKRFEINLFFVIGSSSDQFVAPHLPLCNQLTNEAVKKFELHCFALGGTYFLRQYCNNGYKIYCMSNVPADKLPLDANVLVLTNYDTLGSICQNGVIYNSVALLICISLYYDSNHLFIPWPVALVRCSRLETFRI